ncbi:Plasmodium exported protein, unknown function [Plasmodium ovale]|uniref:EMP3/KAHRP N-terminal domain-containing protein n=1 Tax=Plasmodium ovale TaxID=36330 RepID=A0A1D3UB13_PLAOA|nr:Plasmodium exported protein, unknown function [Plasmodium ovale]
MENKIVISPFLKLFSFFLLTWILKHTNYYGCETQSDMEMSPEKRLELRSKRMLAGFGGFSSSPFRTRFINETIHGGYKEYEEKRESRRHTLTEDMSDFCGNCDEKYEGAKYGYRERCPYSSDQNKKACGSTTYTLSGPLPFQNGFTNSLRGLSGGSSSDCERILDALALISDDESGDSSSKSNNRNNKKKKSCEKKAVIDKTKDGYPNTKENPFNKNVSKDIPKNQGPNKNKSCGVKDNDKNKKKQNNKLKDNNDKGKCKNEKKNSDKNKNEKKKNEKKKGSNKDPEGPTVHLPENNEEAIVELPADGTSCGDNYEDVTLMTFPGNAKPYVVRIYRD